MAKFKARKEYWFTPDIEVNKGLPEDKKIRALISRPDTETRAKLSHMKITQDYSKREIQNAQEKRGKSESDAQRDRSMTFTRIQDTGRILRDHVHKLENCDVEESDSKGKKTTYFINNGVDLASSTAYGIGELVETLCTEILGDELTEEQEKNSESVSASS